MELDEFQHLVMRSLELGIPPDVVAELFELPVDTTNALQKEVRVERYGTADLPDYLEGLQWRSLEHADRMLRSGSPDQAVKIVSAVFGRQLQAAGRRPSSDLEDRRRELMKAFAGVREGDSASAVPGRFVLGNTGDDRRANQKEEDDE